jgi:predicted nucleic acid-binding protein
MPDKAFVDSNIFVYAALDESNNSHKRSRAIELLENIELSLVASTQVVNEFYAVLLKQRISENDIREKASEILNEMLIVSITPTLVRESWKIKDKYSYSYWDSMIIASALS